MRVIYQRLGDYGGVMEELSSTTDCVARVGDVVEFEELAASVVGFECVECREHRLYWEGLTPAERLSDIAAMALHVDEWERMGLEGQ